MGCSDIELKNGRQVLKNFKLRLGLFLAGVIVIVGVSTAVTNDTTIMSSEASEGDFYSKFFKHSAATENIEPVGDSPPVTQGLINYGQWSYRGLCIGCHGVEADGNGAVWELADKWGNGHKLPRKPRDFTSAVFKVRSTPSGSLPTDRDLFMAISRGLVADEDMPAFKFLPERDRWAIVAYLKTLSPVWVEEAEDQEDPIEVGEPPMPTEEIVQAGKDVYLEMKCAKCHGEHGHGDGPSAPQLEDDNGLSIEPRDFSDASMFVAGSDPKGVYQTFTTGFDGTPMPSFADFLDEDQRWQLVWYVMSLRNGWDIEKAREEFPGSQEQDSSG
jgi:mono/diheme cytochrome c family protein